MARDRDERPTVGTNNNKRNKEKKGATDAAPDPRDAPTPGGETRDPRPGTGVGGIAEAVYDDAIEEAVEGIHG